MSLLPVSNTLITTPSAAHHPTSCSVLCFISAFHEQRYNICPES